MSVSAVLMVPPSTKSQEEKAAALLAEAVPEPISGTYSERENDVAQPDGSQSSAPQDEVKVQMEPPGEIAVYQFLNQDGTLILQVPPQQWINLALEISKEFSQEAAPKPPAPVEKGEHNGH
jgi:hypothetical protein